MNFDSIVRAIGCRVLHKGSLFITANLHHVIASDLMSDVLTTELDEILLVSSLCTDQAIRTADIVGARGILFVNGKNIFTPMVQLAAELDVTILSTDLSKFDACVRLGSLFSPNGIPNVAYRAGGIADLIRYEVDGLLVPCGDIGALASALGRMHEDVDLRVQLGIDGRARLPVEFLWEDKLALVRGAIDECVGRAKKNSRRHSACIGRPLQ